MELSPRERRAARTQEAILDAARRLIRKDGVDNLSMRAIAAEVDYSVGALYKYFDSKETLIAEVCMRGLDGLRDRMQAAISGEEDLIKRIVNAGLAYVQFARDNPEVYPLMFAAVPMEPSGNAFEETQQDSAFGVIYGLMIEGAERGILSADLSPLEMAFDAWYFVHGIASLRLGMFTYQGPKFDVMNDRIIRAHMTGYVRR